MRLPSEAWSEIEWREGSNQPLSSRFAAARVRPASRDHKMAPPHPGRRMAGGRGGTDQILALDLAEDMPLAVLVDVIKLRWRIERDYEN